MVNVQGLKPRSVSNMDAASDNVVSAGNFFCQKSPVGKQKSRQASVYETLGLGWGGAGRARVAGFSVF